MLGIWNETTKETIFCVSDRGILIAHPSKFYPPALLLLTSARRYRRGAMALPNPFWERSKGVCKGRGFEGKEAGRGWRNDLCECVVDGVSVGLIEVGGVYVVVDERKST